MSDCFRRIHWLVLALAAMVLVGCPTTGPRTRSAGTSPSKEAGQESLAPALESLDHLEAVTAEEGLNDLAYYLNRWAGANRPEGDWKPDELVERLPRTLRDLIPIDELARSTFDRQDARFVQEASWLRDVSLWATRAAPNPILVEWLAKRQPALDREQTESLLIAERLFDWTIRNIQLQPLLAYPTEGVAVPADAKGGGAAPRMPPYAAGIPGPGYLYQPWQTLLHGQGDAWNRARVFTLLARQQDLDVVTLAIANLKVSPRPQPWVSGVLIGEELFLFDPALGLPLPTGPASDGIATLAEIRAHPDWLTALDLDEKTKYPIREPDLAYVVALIDAVPAALARRHQWLESHLVGDHRLTLHVDASGLAQRLRRVPGINSASLWTLPWEADVMAGVIRRQLGGEPTPELQGRMIEESFMQEATPLVQGRRCHLRGQFANQEGDKGAKGYYLDARLPDEVINTIQTDKRVQANLGLIKDPFESDASWARRLFMAQIVGRESKICASYWLGLVHYEGGQYDVAADWFKTRTFDLPQENRWKPGARYNLARCYEHLNKSVDARLLYLEDTSPQRHGNGLRARRLVEREQAAKDK